MARGFKSAIIIGIFAVTAAAILLGLAKLPTHVIEVPDWRSTFLQLDVRAALRLGLFDVVFVFLFVDLFDTIGSLMGLGQQAGYLTPEGRMPRVNRALFADATATIVGSLFGTSTVVTYIESATGVSEGGRTGLVAVVVSFLFLLAALFSLLGVSLVMIFQVYLGGEVSYRFVAEREPIPLTPKINKSAPRQANEPLGMVRER